MNLGPQDIMDAERAVRQLLLIIGENPQRPGLKDTPSRVVRALVEMTQGYNEDPKEILSKVFEETYDQIVLVRGVPFVSTCEHHLMTFSGTADVGYLPSGDGGEGDGVVGLSKLARLVDCFARRLQVQERLTVQIADAIEEHLNTDGVGVIIRAEHSCMACRGVRKPGAQMVTSVMYGVFRDEPEARQEFLTLCQMR